MPLSVHGRQNKGAIWYFISISMRWTGWLVDEYPRRLQDGERDQANEGRRPDQGGIVDLEAEQQRQAADGDQRRQPVPDGDLAEQEARPEDCADGSGVGALDEALHVLVRAVPDQDRRHDENENERRQENP